MMEIKVVFPHPDGPTSMSSSPRRTSRSMPRSAITPVSPVPYVFVTPRQLTANCSLGPAGSIAYSIVCPSALFRRANVFGEALSRAAAQHGRLDYLPLCLRGALVQSIVLSGFSKNSIEIQEKI